MVWAAPCVVFAMALPWLGSLWTGFLDIPAHSCADAIEIVEAGRPARLGCIADVAALGCRKARSGDKVLLDEAGAWASGVVPACRVEAGGMRAAWLVLWGLPLDVNRHSAAELTHVPGIGPGLAERIVEHRERHGAFAELRDVAAVRGMGGRRLEKLAPYLKTGA